MIQDYEIAKIIEALRQNTSSFKEQIPILKELTEKDTDNTGKLLLYLTLADIYYKLEDHDQFLEHCECTKDYISFVTNPFILNWFKETLLLQAECYVYKEDFGSTVSTIKQLISFLQVHEAAHSEFFDVQERFITLLDLYRGIELVRYKATWDKLTIEEREDMTAKYLTDVNEERRKEFLGNLDRKIQRQPL